LIRRTDQVIFFADPKTGKWIPIPDEFLTLLDSFSTEAT
jgi:acyl-CoA thioesterase FadM